MVARAFYRPPTSIFFLIWGLHTLNHGPSTQRTEGNRQRLAFIINKNIFILNKTFWLHIWWIFLQDIHYRGNVSGHDEHIDWRNESQFLPWIIEEWIVEKYRNMEWIEFQSGKGMRNEMFQPRICWRILGLGLEFMWWVRCDPQNDFQLQVGVWSLHPTLGERPRRPLHPHQSILAYWLQFCRCPNTCCILKWSWWTKVRWKGFHRFGNWFICWWHT